MHNIQKAESQKSFWKMNFERKVACLLARSLASGLNKQVNPNKQVSALIGFRSVRPK